MIAPRLAPRRGAITLVAVVALHVVLWAVVRTATRPAAAAAVPVRLSVRMLAAPRPIVEAQRAEATQRDAAASRDRARPRDSAEQPAPTSAASAATITLSAGDPLAAAPAASAASAPERALDLALPRGFATRPGNRNPAFDDPRSNTARSTPEARFAAALGSADTAIVEEPLSEGRRRIRRGGACVIATPARVSQLLPFDDSATRAPQKIEPC